MLFRSVAKCSAYGTNAMHCTRYQPASQQASIGSVATLPVKSPDPVPCRAGDFCLLGESPNPYFQRKETIHGKFTGGCKTATGRIAGWHCVGGVLA